MGAIKHILHRLGGFQRREDGAALVEFGLLLPMLVILFGVTIEGARIFWGYQNVSAGVRDAARYVSRVAPRNTCSAGTSLASFQSDAENIIKLTLDGASPFIPGVTVTSVSVTHSCKSGNYRNSPVAVAVVTADVRFEIPFAPLIALGGTQPVTFTTSIFDQSRVFGI
ncbi:TadE/TadG family type IV pilus assembly protein [Pelagovum sp. HNIBRBA483]|uniref:TadE/TadG family type IV pilus assembly protein n=1 Tax=Pelagovum sp. HNIBRBA483 TaxID=3233341 RepID=UPI0034A307D0